MTKFHKLNMLDKVTGNSVFSASLMNSNRFDNEFYKKLNIELDNEENFPATEVDLREFIYEFNSFLERYSSSLRLQDVLDNCESSEDFKNYWSNNKDFKDYLANYYSSSDFYRFQLNEAIKTIIGILRDFSATTCPDKRFKFTLSLKII